MEPLYKTRLDSLKLLGRGKVRDIYVIDEARLLLVQTDRISAFDVVFKEPIPGKGAVLTSLSRHWFQKTGHIVPNHLLDDAPEDVVSTSERDVVRQRSLVVQRMEPIQVEAVVRGYLAGSGYKEYLEKREVCGIALPDGLRLAERLARPIFTPATKAQDGLHDENITFEQACRITGMETAKAMAETSMNLYSHAHRLMADKGIILADTKFEFALDSDNKLVLIDEALTPDSSRYWIADSHCSGKNPESLDKQHLRNWIETTGWNKSPPPPSLDSEMIRQLRDRYSCIQGIILGNGNGNR